MICRRVFRFFCFFVLLLSLFSTHTTCAILFDEPPFVWAFSHIRRGFLASKIGMRVHAGNLLYQAETSSSNISISSRKDCDHDSDLSISSGAIAKPPRRVVTLACFRKEKELKVLGKQKKGLFVVIFESEGKRPLGYGLIPEKKERCNNDILESIRRLLVCIAPNYFSLRLGYVRRFDDVKEKLKSGELQVVKSWQVDTLHAKKGKRRVKWDMDCPYGYSEQYDDPSFVCRRSKNVSPKKWWHIAHFGEFDGFGNSANYSLHILERCGIAVPPPFQRKEIETAKFDAYDDRPFSRR